MIKVIEGNSSDSRIKNIDRSIGTVINRLKTLKKIYSLTPTNTI